MKTSINHLTIILSSFFLLSIGFYACNKEDIMENKDELSQKELSKNRGLNSKSGFTYSISDIDDSVTVLYENSNKKYTFIGDNSQSQEIRTSIEVLDKDNGNILFSNSLTQDLEVAYYKLYTRNTLLESADSILDNGLYTTQFFETMKEDLMGLLNIMVDDLTSEYYSEIKHSSLNYHISINEMLLRAKENGSVDCECNTATLYFDDNTGFFCSQDWHFQIESLIDFLDRKDSLYPDSLPVISGVVDSLNNLTTQSISYHELLEISSAESGNSLITDSLSGFELKGDCEGMTGSSLGCCNNYSGPCTSCGLACLVHDLLCICCNYPVANYGPIFCGPSCVPESGCVN